MHAENSLVAVSKIITRYINMKKLIAVLISTLTISSAVSAAKTEKLTVILDWFPNPDHAPLIIAKQQGFFKAQGLDVELIGPADPTDPPKLVAAGKADIGITYEPDLIQQIDHGLPLLGIGNLIDKPLNCLVVLNSSGIKNISDLKGKRIGSSTGGLTKTLIKVMLERAGLKQDDVEFINVKYNITQALLSRQVDAINGAMRNFEVPQLDLMGHKVTAFFPEEYGIPTYSELVFIIKNTNTHDKRLPKFLAAVREGVRYLDEHPKETWAAFAKAYPEANNPVNHEAWFATKPYFDESPATFDIDEWDRFIKFMKQNNLIKNEYPVSHYAIQLQN